MRIIAEDLVGLTEALQAGALTSTALVERAVRRYAETEPQIHAFAWLDAPRAQRMAAASDERRRSEERRVGKECTIQCRSRWSPYH